MGLKYQGNKLAQAFMIEVGKPIDVRAVVDSKSDLIAEATFSGYAYNGMSVVVAATGKIFTLIDVNNITSESSWVEQASINDVIKNEKIVAASLNDLDDRINALKGDVEDSEEAISAALNDLNKKIEAGGAKKFVQKLTSDDGTHSSTITAATHGCGTDPLVSVFYNGSQVIIDQSVNDEGDVTITWATTTTIDASHVLKIVVMG